MTIKELERLIEKIEKSKVEKIKIETQMEEIDKKLKELCNTSDINEINFLLSKQEKKIAELEEKIENELNILDNEIE